MGEAVFPLEHIQKSEKKVKSKKKDIPQTYSEFGLHPESVIVVGFCFLFGLLSLRVLSVCR